MDGFLGENESLEQVILSDDQILRSFNVSHETLITTMSEVISRSKKILRERSGVPIQLNTSEENRLEHCREPLEIEQKIYMSSQFSPFFNDDPSLPENFSDFQIPWNVDFIIRNIKTPHHRSLEIMIGGDERCGSIAMIRHLHFYQGGGVKNPYRLDPYLLNAIFFGRIVKDTLELMVDRRLSQRLILEKRELLEKVTSQLSACSSTSESVWMQDIAKQTQKSLDETTQETLDAKLCLFPFVNDNRSPLKEPLEEFNSVVL